MPNYSLWMLEYARCLAQPVGCILYGQWNAGTREFAYSYVYLEGEGHRILVDVGHDELAPHGRRLSVENDVVDWQPPEVVLGKIGISPDEIDTVILTHAHYDHAGAASLFPHATFYLQRRELERSRWALDHGRLYSSITSALDPDDVAMLERMAGEGTLILLDGSTELLPGIAVQTAFDTHTEGGQYVVVEDPRGSFWVVTGDAMYSYDNAEGIDGSGTSVTIGFGGGSAWAGLDLIEEMVSVAEDTNRLVIVHEAATFSRHPARTDEDGLSVAELFLAPGVASRLR